MIKLRSFLKELYNSIKVMVVEGERFKVSQKVFNKRVLTCMRCTEFDKEKFICNNCKCNIKTKASWTGCRCPLNKWKE